jgi:hypothetical protein
MVILIYLHISCTRKLNYNQAVTYNMRILIREIVSYISKIYVHSSNYNRVHRFIRNIVKYFSYIGSIACLFIIVSWRNINARNYFVNYFFLDESSIDKTTTKMMCLDAIKSTIIVSSSVATTIDNPLTTYILVN